MKWAVERGLLLTGLPRAARWRRRGEVLVLAYHDVVPHGAAISGDRSLHLPRASFARQLDLLIATHDVIPLDEALARGARRASRPSAVITFDDAYRGAVTAGVEELAARGLPATIFVPPAFVGDGVFWWDLLARDEAGEVPPVLRARALAELAGRGDRILERERSAAADPAAIPPHARCASEDELHRAAAAQGIALASHTWSHPNLAALPPEELDAELRRPLAWLRERFAGVLPVLTYPYGLASPAVERAAEEAGYEAALRIEGGWLPRAPRSRYALPRLDVPSGLTPHGFRLRSAGLLG
ncbi:MAG TPA: polysaccharide deacetylase family protein [Gemmatimonadaceae bacterium]|nr:polysaccharide deacetylase family protein [Gemmatimonadaceae bacterium]